MLRITVLDDHQQVAGSYDWSRVDVEHELVALRDHVGDPGELASLLQGTEVLVCMRERTAVTSELLDLLPDLRCIVTTGLRNAVIDGAAARERGIVVCGTGGIVSNTVELTWALILAVLRHLPEEAQRMRDGGWQETIGGDLAGRTIGIVGLGNTGRGVAKVARAFGMDLVAWSPNLTVERAEKAGARLVGKDELFATADVVTLHLVLSDRSRGTVGAAELDRMKPGAILVNTSRGPLVDEAALLDALRSGSIRGAGLDVYDEEPLPADHPLRSAPNVVLTPHLGYVTERLYDQFYAEIIEDVAAYAAGAPIRVLEP